MQTSFFKDASFKVIEREIVENDFPVFSDDKDQDLVMKVYDFFSWKINLSAKNHKIITLIDQEIRIKEFKSKHKNPFGLCITTVEEAKLAAKYARFLYIPGEFCRQGDVLEAAKSLQLPLVVEKGFFLSPNDIGRLSEKIQGADYSLVECGSSNGYSDLILDPRSLYLMQKKSPYFGVSLSDLLAPEGTHYSHRPQWLNNKEFIKAFIKTSKVFDASFFVIKNYGQGQISASEVV
jgi:2-dehydro-3-deoxyphosphooctonate aldolase (KDO 8-P synthase)